jgi:hypothetical protein
MKVPLIFVSAHKKKRMDLNKDALYAAEVYEVDPVARSHYSYSNVSGA